MRKLTHVAGALSMLGLAACASPDPQSIAIASSGLTPATIELEQPVAVMVPAPVAVAAAKAPAPVTAVVAATAMGTDVIQVGRATWYGKKFHGRKTASGEIYNMEGMTAAHAELPLGTWIQVTNMGNGKVVRLKVNDRLPAKTAVLDVSARAARELGFQLAGATDVIIESDTNIAEAD